MTEASRQPGQPLVALVTGGAGGIGAAICTKLSRLGYRLVVVDLDLAAAQAVAAEVGGAAFAADVSDHEQNRAMVDFARQRFGRLDLAVFNAGRRSDHGADEPLDLAFYRQLTSVNLDGPVFGIDAVAPALAGTGGAIIVMASLAALGPEQANPLYALGKAAVVGYVRAISGPLAQRGITINAICPSFTDTPFLGIERRLMRKQNFPLLQPAEVADAIQLVLQEPGTGQAWAVVAGRPPVRVEFPPVPTTLRPDGTEVTLRAFLAPR